VKKKSEEEKEVEKRTARYANMLPRAGGPWRLGLRWVLKKEKGRSGKKRCQDPFIGLEKVLGTDYGPFVAETASPWQNRFLTRFYFLLFLTPFYSCEGNQGSHRKASGAGAGPAAT